MKDSVHVSDKKEDLNPSPVTSKSETVFLHVNSFVTNVHSVTGFATKERCKSQLLSQSHRNKICERCFLCRSLVFCKYCHKYPNCCRNSTCRGKATSVLGEVGSFGFESKSSHNTERGLHPPFPVQTQSNQVTNCHKQLFQPTKTVPPFGGTVSAYKNKNAVESVANQSSLGFYNRLFLVPKPNNRWRPILDLSTLNTFLNTVVQNGDPRDNKSPPTARGVGQLHRLQGCIFPYTNSQSVQEVGVFSHPGSVLPVESPTHWSVHSTHGVHSGGQRGQTDGFTEGYKNPPVPR